MNRDKNTSGQDMNQDKSENIKYQPSGNKESVIVLGLNAYQTSQLDRQIRVIEAVTDLAPLQHPAMNGAKAVLLNASRIMSDILAGEGSDNPAKSAEASDQIPFLEEAAYMTERICSGQ